MIYSVEYVESACHSWGIVREAFIVSIVLSCLCGLHCIAVGLSGSVLCLVLSKIMKSTNITQATVAILIVMY